MPPAVEVLQRYLAALRGVWPLAAIAVGVAALLVLPQIRRLTGNRPPWVRTTVAAVVVVGGLLWAWKLRWLCDDAFISFRYAENLARGEGLVFNPSERIEGYTNFLWTVLIAGFIKLGLDPGQTALVLGLGSFATLLVVVTRLAERLADTTDRELVGVVTLLVASSYTLACFATSGLETMLATVLALVAVERAEASRPASAGLAGIAAVMAHPDHAILYAALGLALLLDRDRRRGLVRYALPFLLVYVPYFILRWQYYGELMPNTFHAKSADRAYFGQGSLYLYVSLVTAGLWGVLPLGLYGAVRFARRLTARYFLIAAPLFLVYVAKIGGDFMQGRLLCPLLPALFLLADLGLRDILRRGRPVIAFLALVPAAAAALPTNILGPWEKKWHLADERSFYELASFAPIVVRSQYFDQGQKLRRHITDRGFRPKVAVQCVGMIGYYSRLPILDLLGLTSREIARLPIGGRGRPGHEKMGSPGHVFAGGADLSELAVYPAPHDALGEVELDGLKLHLVRYDPDLVAPLRASGARLHDFRRHLETYMGSGAIPSPDALTCDLWHAGAYYFSVNDDPPLRQRLTDQAVEWDPSLAGAEPYLLGDRSPAAAGLREVAAIRFNAGTRDGWTATGDAFSSWPAIAPAPGQGEVVGRQGEFVDTFTAGKGDAATGTLLSPPFTLTGDVLTLMVGGGRHHGDLRVSLLVDGQPVRSTAGCGSEIMGRRAWPIADLRGKRASVEIVDRISAGWGHIVLDEIVEWRR